MRSSTLLFEPHQDVVLDLTLLTWRAMARGLEENKNEKRENKKEKKPLSDRRSSKTDIISTISLQYSVGTEFYTLFFSIYSSHRRANTLSRLKGPRVTSHHSR